MEVMVEVRVAAASALVLFERVVKVCSAYRGFVSISSEVKILRKITMVIPFS